ncbi:hypothetical protein TRIUR3_17209 [Triticum urartu]|uniref:Uncharacterized protein n=1 Tax=Triticum urartu TaxID=4572 RepID=M7ZI85_TRIUA|nr:hypothetical protein TRIUR3_17209 [Triticum urartu]
MSQIPPQGLQNIFANMILTLKFAARSSGGGGRPEPKAGDDESKAVLDAFFLGKALAEALTERAESVVGEVFSVVGQWQAEQQKQVQEFQEPDATVDDDSYYTGGAYYYVQAAADDQE